MMSNDDVSGNTGASAGFDRSYFHRNLSSFNTPEVSRSIRKCHGKDETTRSSRRWKLSIPHSFPRYSSKIEKSIVLLSSVVPTRKRRREANDFTPSFVQVIAAFVDQGSFFKIIRWKGNAAHQRDVERASPTIFRVDGSDRGTQQVTIKFKKGSKMEKTTRRERKKERREFVTQTGRWQNAL